MKNIEASVGAVPKQIDKIREKTFEKIFEKMRRVKMMEIDVQKRENDFFWDYIQKPISTQEERDDRDILKRAAHLRFAEEWRAIFRERDEILEISTDIRELVGARKKKNDAEKFAKWKEILKKIEKQNKIQYNEKQKNKYKEKDVEKRRKERNKMRREVNNKKWMLWV